MEETKKKTLNHHQDEKNQTPFISQSDKDSETKNVIYWSRKCNVTQEHSGKKGANRQKSSKHTKFRSYNEKWTMR